MMEDFQLTPIPADAELGEMLEALGRDMERRLKDVQQRALLLHEMMDSYSNTLQLSPIRRCVAENPAEELKDLSSLPPRSRTRPTLNSAPVAVRRQRMKRRAVNKNQVWKRSFRESAKHLCIVAPFSRRKPMQGQGEDAE